MMDELRAMYELLITHDMDTIYAEIVRNSLLKRASSYLCRIEEDDLSESTESKTSVLIQPSPLVDLT